jgi:alpha-glucosidase (family GH31 glycosyl hydrolase)
MIPFLYTWSYLTSKEGRALVEPLYYEWKDEKAYEYKEEYLFGGLLVAPIVQAANRDGYACVKAWIPEGQWTDIFTGDYYVAPAGGREVTLFRTMESIPVFAKAGTILPLSMDKGNGVQNPVRLGIKVYQGNGEFTLYEDGRENGDTREVFTHFEGRLQEVGKQTIRIWTEGNAAVLPNERTMRITFEDIPEGQITLYKNGQKQEVENLYLSCAAVEFTFDATAEYLVEVAFKPLTEMQAALVRAKRIFTHAEANNRCKERLFLELEKAKTMEQFVEIVNTSSLKTSLKRYLLENL